MKHIYALFALLITSFISWGQTETLFSFTGTSGYLATPAPGWSSSGTEGGGYLKLSPGSVTSPEFSPANNVVFKYDIGSFGSGTGSNTKLFILDNLDNVISEFTLTSSSGGGTYTTNQIVNVGNITSNFKVKIEGFGNGSSERGTRLRNYSLVGEIIAVSCEDSNFVFASTEVSADLAEGTLFTQTATSLNQTTAITYTSSDEDVATVNPTTGEVTLVSVGTTTITATQAAGEHNGESYCAATATYQLEVITTAPVLTVSTNSLSFTGYEGGEATTQNLTITGLNLSGDISLALTGDANFAINPTTLSATGGDVTITYTPSATPASHSATLTVTNGAFSEVILLTANTLETPNECGFEDFSNSELTSSYADGNFVGNNGITWSYIESRDENGDANESGINGKAIMLRRSSDNSSISSSVISNGIGNFSVKLYKGFTGNGNRQVELFINGVSQGTSTPFNDYEEHIFEVNNINIAGDFTIEIKNITSSQVIIDDITWTCYSEEPTPALSVNFTQEDLHIEHNINVTTPTVAEAIINIENLTEESNLSVVSTNADFVVSTTGELANGANTIQIQLANGLEAGEYTGSIIVTLGEEVLATLPLTGEVIDTPLSNTENQIEGLRIYPNPATDVVFVTSNSGAMKNVQLFDLSGKKVLDVHTTSSFQVDALANGIYVMKVTEEGKTSTSKLIVK